MRLKNYLYRLTGAISAFALLACVDDSFNLDDVSTEVIARQLTAAAVAHGCSCGQVLYLRQ